MPKHPCSQKLLLQALIDKNTALITRYTSDDFAQSWIDAQVGTKSLKSVPENMPSGLDYLMCLLFSCRFNNLSTVQQLKSAGASVRVKDAFGRTALHWACQSVENAMEKVRFLLDWDLDLLNKRDCFNNTNVQQQR